jgi:cephalosporin-C deacetylase-like acetyl esterase
MYIYTCIYIYIYMYIYQAAKDDLLGPNIDSSRIALWGTSFAGGHVIVAGSQLKKDIRCIISQIPHMDGRLASIYVLTDKMTSYM